MSRLANPKLLIKIALSVAILGVLYFRMDQNALKDMVQHMKASAWLYATVFIVIQLALISLRWMLLINIGHRRMNYTDSLQVTLTSLLANMLFFTSLGGVFVRIALALQRSAGASMAACAVMPIRVSSAGSVSSCDICIAMTLRCSRSACCGAIAIAWR